MFGQIASFLIQTFFSLFVYLLLLRFLMQTCRAPFRNPLGQFIIALTDWAVRPMRRIIPGAGGLDLATLLLAWFTLIIKTLLLFALISGTVSLGVTLLLPLIELARALLHVIILVTIVQAILSWFGSANPFSPVFDALTRPFYNVFRRIVPAVGGIDLSPLFVIVIAQILLIVLDNLTPMLLTSL